MDDDVMDQQKYCASAMLLAKALVDKEREAAGDRFAPQLGRPLPEIPLHEARQIMTRADFVQSYDHINVFTIASRAMVRAESVPMQNAFREICSQPGFEKHLQATLDRIGAIESLGRTRELVAKDLVIDGMKYKVSRVPSQYPANSNFEVTSQKVEKPRRLCDCPLCSDG